MRIKQPHQDSLKHFAEGVFEAMMGMTRWVMRFAPIGVFALAALLVHFVVVMPLSLKFVAQANPWRLYKIMMPALLTAFSTVPIKV